MSAEDNLSSQFEGIINHGFSAMDMVGIQRRLEIDAEPKTEWWNKDQPSAIKKSPLIDKDRQEVVDPFDPGPPPARKTTPLKRTNPQRKPKSE